MNGEFYVTVHGFSAFVPYNWSFINGHTFVEFCLMDAQDRRIAEQDQEIAELKAEVASLRSLVAALEKNSGNSSKPPSSDIVKPPKQQDRRRKKKIGGQKGHKQNLRTPFSDDQIDQTIALKLDSCPKCGGTLKATNAEPKKHQQVELVKKPFFVTEYHQHQYWCEHCQCDHH